MPVLPVPQMSPMWDEKGGGAGGEAEGKQVMIDQNYDQGLGMKMMMIVFRGQNGEDEVESTSLGPGDMPTGFFFFQRPTFHDMPTLNVIFSLKYWLKNTQFFIRVFFQTGSLKPRKFVTSMRWNSFPTMPMTYRSVKYMIYRFRFIHGIYR